MTKEPIRTCIVCKITKTKKELIRFTKDGFGLRLDLSYKLPGRGAYVCFNPICWKGLLRKGTLGKSLKLEVTDSELKSITTNLMEQIKIDRRTDGKDKDIPASKGL